MRIGGTAREIPAVLIAACLSITLLAGCANSLPVTAAAMMSPASGAGHVSMNILSNYGRTEFDEGEKARRSDEWEAAPSYSNVDGYSAGSATFGEYGYFGFSMVNFQLQAVGGAHWKKRIALGYFPVLTLTGRHLLHGLQLDVKIPAGLGVLSAQAYQENIPSIRSNPLFGEQALVLLHRVAGVSVSIPLVFRKYRVWIIPNYRRSLDYRFHRFGANLALSRDFGEGLK